MALDDGTGTPRSYLASEAAFGLVRAPRAISAYARAHQATVSAFHLFNVEPYLRQDGRWEACCRNVTGLPLDGTSTFIRSYRGGARGRASGFFPMFASSLGGMLEDTQACAAR